MIELNDNTFRIGKWYSVAYTGIAGGTPTSGHMCCIEMTDGQIITESVAYICYTPEEDEYFLYVAMPAAIPHLKNHFIYIAQGLLPGEISYASDETLDTIFRTVKIDSITVKGVSSDTWHGATLDKAVIIFLIRTNDIPF